MAPTFNIEYVDNGGINRSIMMFDVGHNSMMMIIIIIFIDLIDAQMIIIMAVAATTATATGHQCLTNGKIIPK